MSIYDDMRQALVQEITLNSKQGAYVYLKPGTVSGPDYNPTIGDPTEHDVQGIKRGGRRKNEYIAGGQIVSSDTLLMVLPFDVDPQMDGKMTINGTIHQIVMIDPITDVVPPLGWYIGCRS